MIKVVVKMSIVVNKYDLENWWNIMYSFVGKIQKIIIMKEFGFIEEIKNEIRTCNKSQIQQKW